MICRFIGHKIHWNQYTDLTKVGFGEKIMGLGFCNRCGAMFIPTCLITGSDEPETPTLTNNHKGE